MEIPSTSAAFEDIERLIAKAMPGLTVDSIDAERTQHGSTSYKITLSDGRVAKLEKMDA